MVAQVAGVEVDDAQVRAALARLVAAVAAPRATFDRIGSYLVAATLDRFDREQGPDGKPWQKSVRALADGGLTLTDTGGLRGSITHNVAGDGRAVDVGSNLVYAAIHQFGGQAGRNKSVTLPARPYLGIDARDRDAIVRIVRGALARAARP